MSRKLSSRINNFDALRLAAAVMVLVSHAFPLSGRHEPGVLGTSDTLGFVGVLIFFSVSGLLVTQSWFTDPRPIVFTVKRVLRIVPGLLISLVVTAYVIGPFVTTSGTASYLASLAPIRYVIGNVVMLTDYALPGVFSHNPSSTVNGSLGTLPVEIKAYVMLALLALLFATRRARTRAALGVAVILALVASFSTGVKPFWALLDLFALFAGAAGLFLIRERVPLRVGLAILAVAVWILSYHLPLAFHAALMGVSFPYVVAYLALVEVNWPRRLTAHGDLSYGLYVYAFPVTQVVVSAGLRAPLLVAATTLCLTYPLAFLSWRFVERPALARKRQLGDTLLRAESHLRSRRVQRPEAAAPARARAEGPGDGH